MQTKQENLVTHIAGLSSLALLDHKLEQEDSIWLLASRELFQLDLLDSEQVNKFLPTKPLEVDLKLCTVF